MQEVFVEGGSQPLKKKRERGQGVQQGSQIQGQEELQGQDPLLQVQGPWSYDA